MVNVLGYKSLVKLLFKGYALMRREQLSSDRTIKKTAKQFSVYRQMIYSILNIIKFLL